VVRCSCNIESWQWQTSCFDIFTVHEPHVVIRTGPFCFQASHHTRHSNLGLIFSLFYFVVSVTLLIRFCFCHVFATRQVGKDIMLLGNPIRLFILPGRYCYLNVSWIAWTILMKLTGNIFTSSYWLIRFWRSRSQPA